MIDTAAWTLDDLICHQPAGRETPRCPYATDAPPFGPPPSNTGTFRLARMFAESAALPTGGAAGARSQAGGSTRSVVS